MPLVKNEFLTVTIFYSQHREQLVRDLVDFEEKFQIKASCLCLIQKHIDTQIDI